MNPELSKRVANIINYLTFNNMIPGGSRLQFAIRIDLADKFEDLSQDDQDAIARAERELDRKEFEYVEPEVKLNYKCKREDSPDGNSNKCSETKDPSLKNGFNDNAVREYQKVHASDIEGMTEGIKPYKKSGSLSFHDDNGNGIIATIGGKEVGYALENGDGTLDLSVAEEYNGQQLGEKIYKEYERKYHKATAKKEKTVKGTDYNPHTEPIKFKKNLKISNDIIKDNPIAAEEGIKNWVYRSGDVTLELINNPRADYSKIIDDNEKNAFAHNIAVHISTLMDKSVMKEPMRLYTGVDPELFDIIPKDNGKEFEVNTFLSTSRKREVALGFANRHSSKWDQEALRFVPGDGYLLEINTKPGDKALVIEDYVEEIMKNYSGGKDAVTWIVGEDGQIEGTGNQREVIMNRNVRYRIKDSYVLDASNPEIGYVKKYNVLRVETV